MFARVALPAPGDAATLAGTPVRVEELGDEPFFSQPCAAFDGCCSIYDVRPSNCRAFKCSLLRRHDAGEVRTGDARRVIRATLDMRDRALASIGQRLAVDDLSFPEIQTRLANLQAEESSASSAHMEMLLDVAAVNSLLAKHFLPTPPSDTTSP